MKMTFARMMHLIKSEIPFQDLVNNAGIYEFYWENVHDDEISIGISFEDDEN